MAATKTATATKESIVEDIRNLPRDEQKDVIEAAQGFLGITNQRQLGTLYIFLLGILAIIAILSGMGAFVLYADGRDSAVGFMTVLTTIVGGLVGIFAPSPTGK